MKLAGASRGLASLEIDYCSFLAYNHGRGGKLLMEARRRYTSWLNPERRWVLAFAAVVMLLTTIPYLFGYVSQGEDWRFTGFVVAVDDGLSLIHI